MRVSDAESALLRVYGADRRSKPPQREDVAGCLRRHPTAFRGALLGVCRTVAVFRPNMEIRSSLVYERLMNGDAMRRVSADPVDRLAPVRRP
jgi:hypothetical protein